MEAGMNVWNIFAHKRKRGGSWKADCAIRFQMQLNLPFVPKRISKFMFGYSIKNQHINLLELKYALQSKTQKGPDLYQSEKPSGSLVLCIVAP